MPAFQKSIIKNIIFDLGGVLLNINPLLSLMEFERVSGIDKEVLISRFISEGIFEKFDTGSLSPVQFASELERIIGIETGYAEIERIWNLLILDFPVARVEVLKELKKNYKVYLLSNTNFIHIAKYTNDFYKIYGFPMEDLFDRMYYSCEIGIHKPDDGVYKFVLQHAALIPSETLFIDDSKANVDAAEQLGISAIHIRNGQDVTDFFENGILR